MTPTCAECGDVLADDEIHFDGIEMLCESHCPDCSERPVVEVSAPPLNGAGG